jgi:hypothetical protein
MSRSGPAQRVGAEENCLDVATVQDLLEMYRSSPVLGLARKSFLAKVLGEPFTFSIPAIGVQSNKDMEHIISMYWMPFLRSVYDWCMLFGVCPYYFVSSGGAGGHKIPMIPDMNLGYVTVGVTKDHRYEYKWYWQHDTSTEQDTRMLWIVTDNHPRRDGTLCSPLVSLLPEYGSLLKLQRAQDVAATQCARPVHVMEHVGGDRFGKEANDNLTHLVADFGTKAAGISAARQEAASQQRLRVKTAELYKQLQSAQRANTMQSTVQQTLWTDTAADTLEEMDAGFSSRVVVMRPDFKYTSAAKPTLVGDYEKARSSFNTMAAAVMGFSMEMLTPVGQARSQNIQGALDFENDRIRDQSAFFVTVLRSALIIAYRDQFKQVMEDARSWRINKLNGGDPSKVVFLYPELDVQIDMAAASLTTYSELKQMHSDGLITKETMGMHVFKNKNLPAEQMVTLEWPDKVPRELLVTPKQQQKQQEDVPPKKKKKQKVVVEEEIK